MATTLNHLIYDILNTIRAGKGGTSDDENLSQRWIEFQIHTVRAQLIRQDLEKNRSVSNNIRQSLGCVGVSVVDASLCCSLETDCTVFRTDIKIPKTIELYQRDLITRVGPASINEKPFQLIPYERAAWAGNTPFEKLNNVPKAFLFDDYIYIMVKDSSKVISTINIQGVFSDPTEVKAFNTCAGETCFTYDSPYPISDNMIPLLKKMVIENSVRFAAMAPSDNIGDNAMKVEGNTESGAIPRGK